MTLISKATGSSKVLTSGFPPMHFLQINSLQISKTIAVCLFFSALVNALPLCFAGDREELAAVNALIAIIESGNTGHANEAEEHFKSIPAASNSKPIAAYTLALVQIREHQFSQAWKTLTAHLKNLGPIPDSIKLGNEKLKLWLLLEAGAQEKAEPQFKRLVTMSLGADSATGEQTANCGFIGGVVGMLKTDEASSCVPSSTLEKAKELLLTKVDSRNAKTELEVQLAETSKWGAELSSLVSKFESMGTDKADEQNSSTQAKFEQTKQEQLKLRGDLKSAGGGKRDLEEKRKKLIKARNITLQEMNKETIGKPVQPVAPAPLPRAPSPPKGSNRVDPKTLAAEFVPPTDDAVKHYEVAQRNYNLLATAWSNYQRAFQQYPAKLQLWEKQDADRRAALQAQKQALENDIASIENQIKDVLDGIKQGVGKDLKQTGEQIDQLERLAAISRFAFKHVASNEPKSKHLIRPSNFQLLDYESECIRLRKLLR